MEQFEKVVKGLQTAVDSDWMWRKADYIAMCCKDALALIRQQQERIKELEAERQWHSCGNCDIPAALLAKVMTLEEVKGSEVVYLEDFSDPDDGVEPIIRLAANVEAKNGGIVMLDSVAWDEGFIFVVDSEYGKTWRCWTKRPTEAERKEAKWDE